MTVKVLSIGLKGLEGYRVQVEVQASFGSESMVIVGLPDVSVKESKERVLSAIRTLGCDVTNNKIVVNLSPSEQRKNGPLFDLAMAIGVLKEMAYFEEEIPDSATFIGAVSLDGTVVKVEGMLPALIAAKTLGFKRVYLPYDPLIRTNMFEDLDFVVISHIKDVLFHLAGHEIQMNTIPKETEKIISMYEFQSDFCHIIGHKHAKEALEIAAAGGHHVLMSGPPGCGKSLLAETFHTILPFLSNKSQLEVISLYQLANEKLVYPQIAPYRRPHHSSSSVAIIGGGSYPKPGEISLTHCGVLFLDEMAEFTKKTLDMLRQPLETGKITISRAHSTVTYPATFILIGAMNPCPCGYLGSSTHYCSCTSKQIQAYKTRVSGPVFDRVDILLSLKSVNLDQDLNRVQETSSDIRKRVEKAREIQYKRYGEEIFNARVPFEQLCATSPLTENQRKMITQISANQIWSNRVQIKIIRLARTISDLAGDETIKDESIWKAANYRRTNQQQPSIIARKR